MSRVIRLLNSGLLLKCPRCGLGPLFYGLFSMHSQCSNCSLEFEREQGYFVGAIYINYSATVIIAIPGYFILDYFFDISLTKQLALWIGFAILFPLLFFRHSRSFWLTLDHFFNPPENTLYPVPKISVRSKEPNRRTNPKPLS